MLIVKKISENTEGTWFERKIWGATLRFKIRPRNDEVVKDLRKKFKHIRSESEREEKILRAFKDYILEDFEGVGDAPDSPWQVTSENKDRLLSLDVPFGEQPLYAWVIDRANELAVEVIEDEIKNS